MVFQLLPAGFIDNGVSAATGWVHSDDGFLVYDRNNDGLINSGSELFGDYTPLGNGEFAKNGFAALADLDVNGDGIIDAEDEAFAHLKVWRDLNQNGKTDAGELFTLQELQIKSLNLAHENTNKIINGGNILTQIGSYTKEDGTVHQMGDVNLVDDQMHTVFDPLELTEEQANQANIRGQGRLRDLRDAAALSGHLNELLTQYSQAQTRDQQMALIGSLVAAWAMTDPNFKIHDDDDIVWAVASSSGTIIWVQEGNGGNFVLEDPDMIAAQKKLKELFKNGTIAILDAFTGITTEPMRKAPQIHTRY